MSDYKVPSFLKRDKEALLFNTSGELVFYVPEYYFERKYAVVNGEYVNSLGIFTYTIFDEKGKNNGLKNFYFPTRFLCRPYAIEKVKNIKLTKNTDPQDYRLLKFKKGDQVVVSVKVPEDIINAEDFYKMFITGKTANTIRYDELIQYFDDNIKLNGSAYKLNKQLFGILVAEMCRDPKDIKKLFRHTDMKDLNDYRIINIKQIPKLVSAFTSITSENKEEALVNAVLNKNNKYSPLEKLFTETGVLTY